jgi:hypothetical protein
LNSVLEGLDIIKDFNWAEGHKIQIYKVQFGITNLTGLSYNYANGGLFFQETQLATLENTPANFMVSVDIQLV